MADYNNTNRGVLFENENRPTPNHPDRKGTITTMCCHCRKTTDFWISAWWKRSRVGQILSLAVTEKEEQESKKAPAPVIDQPPKSGTTSYSPPPIDDFEDDIPF